MQEDTGRDLFTCVRGRHRRDLFTCAEELSKDFVTQYAQEDAAGIYLFSQEDTARICLHVLDGTAGTYLHVQEGTFLHVEGEHCKDLLHVQKESAGIF